GAGTNAGGAVSITSGAGGNGSVAGLAGAISIAPGAAGTTASTPGAAVNITGGATATTGAVGTGGNVNLTGGASTLGFGGSIVVTPGAGGAANGNGTFRGVKAAYSGGTQAISGTGGAFNITTADGSSAIFFTVNTSNTTTATINGCSTGVYPQGALLTVIVVGGGGAFSWTVTNATMAALAVDQILLNGAVTYATAATANGTARGSSLTLMCSTVNAVKAWVEVGRNIHLL
ncbi:MAG: hypothetical protein ACXVA9_11415, partial [Bdellovibrionales bacterium]